MKIRTVFRMDEFFIFSSPLRPFQSFTDQSMASGYPLVVITNPKHAQYLAPSKEPLKSIFQSTHVRVLAFSDVRITRVTVYIDDGNVF